MTAKVSVYWFVSIHFFLGWRGSSYNECSASRTTSSARWWWTSLRHRSPRRSNPTRPSFNGKRPWFGYWKTERYYGQITTTKHVGLEVKLWTVERLRFSDYFFPFAISEFRHSWFFHRIFVLTIFHNVQLIQRNNVQLQILLVSLKVKVCQQKLWRTLIYSTNFVHFFCIYKYVYIYIYI